MTDHQQAYNEVNISELNALTSNLAGLRLVRGESGYDLSPAEDPADALNRHSRKYLARQLLRGERLHKAAEGLARSRQSQAGLEGWV